MKLPKMVSGAWLIATTMLFLKINCDELYFDWHVKNENILFNNQSVITINGMFPGPLINCTTNDIIHVNVFNHLDEPLLITWNGIEQRLNSWQDGVSGTNCPILAGANWTYNFNTKDQIGTFHYFLSTNFQKYGGGYGPIRVNNRVVIVVPFPKPESEFNLLIGDWSQKNYKEVRSMISSKEYIDTPDMMLINGKGPYWDHNTWPCESFMVEKGKTYRFRVSNVGSQWSFNFRIQNHQMMLVEAEGSYTHQLILDSLDVHVGQSYSVLVMADQVDSDYYIVASPKFVDSKTNLNYIGVGVLHYSNSTTNVSGPLPTGPDPFDVDFSLNQARNIRWNLTAGAARPNPQGSFNISNVVPAKTYHLSGSAAEIDGSNHYMINNVAYINPETPLKLADYFNNGSGVYELDLFPTNTSIAQPRRGVFVATGIHKDFIEIIFQNYLDVIDSWHLDGFAFFVMGFGDGKWKPEARSSYNKKDPICRSTVQVYPGKWTAVYAYLDNPGMWNLRSQILKHWYLGQELYLRVYDPDPNPAKEIPAPQNLLLCGEFNKLTPSPSPPSTPPTSAAANSIFGSSSITQTSWFQLIVMTTFALLVMH